jgi:hypothetical protein
MAPAISANTYCRRTSRYVTGRPNIEPVPDTEPLKAVGAGGASTAVARGIEVIHLKYKTGATK